jgi:uncharacterized protein (TIGR00725 family)
MIIAVIGGDDAPPEAFVLAEAVGREIAKRGALLICGGLGGVMESACRGAKAEGGTTIGVLPGTDAAEANAYVDIPIVTGMNQARNIVIVRTADAVIAIGGGFGTLSEMAFTLRFGKPLVGLATWSMQYSGVPASFEVSNDAVQAVALAVSLAAANQGVKSHG